MKEVVEKINELYKLLIDKNGEACKELEVLRRDRLRLSDDMQEYEKNKKVLDQREHEVKKIENVVDMRHAAEKLKDEASHEMAEALKIKKTVETQLKEKSEELKIAFADIEHIKKGLSNQQQSLGAEAARLTSERIKMKETIINELKDKL